MDKNLLQTVVKVEKEIDKIRKRFLRNSSSSDCGGYHLARWQNICRKKHHDRLRIINIRNINSAIKCKLLWNLLARKENNSPGGILNTSFSHMSPLWRELKSSFVIVNNFSSFSVHNG